MVSSVIIAIYRYTVKRLLFSKKGVKGAEREKQELEPLNENENILQKSMNFETLK